MISGTLSRRRRPLLDKGNYRIMRTNKQWIRSATGGHVTTRNAASSTSHYNIADLVNFYLQFFVYDFHPSRDDLWLFRRVERERQELRPTFS